MPTTRIGAAIVLRTGNTFGADLLGARRDSLYGLTGSDSVANDILTVKVSTRDMVLDLEHYFAFAAFNVLFV